MNYKLHRCDGAHPDFLYLIRELDRELRAYSSDHEDVFIAQNLVPRDVHVGLVCQGEDPVGCACLRAFESDDFELKRMYVLPEHRGRGLSRMILENLEKWALEMGGKRIILETGEILKEAVGLYKTAGYTVIENYGPYMGITESVCFEKRLSE